MSIALPDILFCSFYVLLCSVIILWSKWFKIDGFKKVSALLIFYVKLLFGLLLWYIYAYHYKNRLTSDIFKYFDDGKILYSSIHNSFSDFLKMLTGIGDTGPVIKNYYMQMNSWGNSYGTDLYGNSHFIIRLNALLMFISGGHYGVHVIVMCFLSLIGLTCIYKTFYPYLSEKKFLLFAAVFLFPSVLLWGSGILKEGLILLGLGLSVYYLEKLKEPESKLKSFFFILVGCLLLLENKAYVLICILPCLISEFILSCFEMAKKRPLIIYTIVTLLYLSTGLIPGAISPKYDVFKMLSSKQEEFNRITRGGIYLVMKDDSTKYAYLPVKDSLAVMPASPYSDSLLHNTNMQYLASPAFCYQEKQSGHVAYFTIRQGLNYVHVSPFNKDTIQVTSGGTALYRMDIYDEPAKSRIEIAPIEPTIIGLIKGVPQALSISMLRPFGNEAHSSAMLIYLVENHIILLLIVLALIFFTKGNKHKNKILFCLTYCLLMLVLIGLVTPIYGGIERYKVVVMPFLLILLLLIYDKEKVKRLLKLKK